VLLKSDIINEAYSLLRISGLTVEPSPADSKLALSRLENLAAELETRQITLNYNFQVVPDANDAAGIVSVYKYSVACILAFRLFPDFGKGEKPDQSLIALVKSSSSFLYSSTATVYPTPAPHRQPVGSGNELRYSRYHPFYREPAIAPNEVATNIMYIDDVENFVESFSDYLKSGEIISSYTIEADTGLTISGDTISTSTKEIDYTVTATGTSDDTASEAFLRVKIVVTTSASRIVTRVINFKLLTVEI
jgi:hypothetical protein